MAVRPSARGLGLELDSTNTVVTLVPGGAALAQGGLEVGDTIVSVNGAPLRGRLLRDVLDRTAALHTFEVRRIGPPPASASAGKGRAGGSVRRSLSFTRLSRRPS